MGIVNVTPDSFSDGGRFLDPGAAVAHGLALVAEGAEMIDVGGESTRPRALPVAESEELRRVVPVIARLARETSVPISIDTRKPGVAEAALDAGAVIINDIAANRTDAAMWRLAARTGAGYVCMHMRGEPETMQDHPVYDDVVADVAAFFSGRLQQLNGCGVRAEQIIFDPGIGFGKTTEHNLRLLGAIGEFRKLNRPLLLGVSRKSFMGHLLGLDLNSRLPAALACTVLALEEGVNIIRAHDVRETVQAARMAEAVLARRNE